MSDPCRSCGAPLADDQRYCLNCGLRCGPPRVDPRLQPPPAAVPPQEGAPPPGDERPQRDYTPLAAVGGIAVLGLMLLIGVLIGKGDSSSTPVAPPQIVRLGDEAGAGATASSEGANSNPKKAGRAAKPKGGEKASSGKDLTSGGGGAGPVEASDQALQELQEQSPDEYSKSSAKLPDEIATPGAAPPTDSKAPGGGSKGTAIE
jgi:hypothetical protein